MDFFQQLEQQIPKGKVRTRFAPSPTGYMHIIAVSDGTNISWSQEPCNDYSSGDSSVNASAGGTGGNSRQEETCCSPPIRIATALGSLCATARNIG